MSILVVCPGCRKSYQVSDKFAGKLGPCPNCKRILRVPTSAEEVRVHAPAEFASGGRDASGKLTIKPIARTDTKFEPMVTSLIVAASLVVFTIAWVGGRLGLFHHSVSLALGLFLISPPLVVGAYALLRDDELEPYRGKSLYLRSAICAGAYIVLWGLFALLAARGVISGQLWGWLFLAPPLLATGGLIASATLDLDFGVAMVHYGAYLLATVVLHWIVGMKWIWELSR